MGSSDNRSPPRTVSEPSRHVRSVQVDGVQWTVHEILAPAFDSRGEPHLLFESDQILRRLREYPRNWHLLSDVDLFALTDRIR